MSQHTESVRVSLTADREIFIAAECNLPSLPTPIKEAFHSLATAAKRSGTKRVLFAMIIAGATLAGVHAADASTVTTTITGTLLEGTDYTGVFGFAPQTNITGQTFKLVFSFDDTKGTQSIQQDATGTACGSTIANTATSNPGTAVLQIGSGSWTLGTLPGDAPSSTTSRKVGNCGNQLTYDVGDVSGGSQIDDHLGGTLNLTEAIPTADYNWEDALSTTQFSGSSQLNLVINLKADRASAVLIPTNLTVSGLPSGPTESTSLQFVPVTPCRVADTRNAIGPFGGPELGAGTSREFDIPQSACSIPSNALAYSLNVTVVPNGPLGYLTMWPSGQMQPTVSTLNSDGRVKANAAITPVGSNGGVSVFVTNPSHVILDIDGYFVPAGGASALAFYPVTPCRVVDTRNGNGSLGGPSLAGGSSRAFPLQSSNCALPSDAKAYSLNVTTIPKGALGYLTMWPTGQAQPLVSTLNAPTGTVTANGAIVPAGSNGDVSIYVSNLSDVVVDVNGYFAEPGANGLSFYTVTPCRVLDTRSALGAFNGEIGAAIETTSCAESFAARAYVLNATVVPTASLGYLTLWPGDGEPQPVVSTLNAEDGAVTSNMAIVPTTDGSVLGYSSNSTQLILDLSGYFAP